MAEKKALVVYAAAYETVGAALAGLDAIEQLHKDGEPAIEKDSTRRLRVRPGS